MNGGVSSFADLLMGDARNAVAGGSLCSLARRNRGYGLQVLTSRRLFQIDVKGLSGSPNNLDAFSALESTMGTYPEM